jgi:signal transduction histidine kinase
MVAIGNQIGQFMEREMAEEALRRAHDELEKRVQERTGDLMAANAQLENSIQERKRLEHELLEITEKERRRIGLDLHDDLGQKLAGLTLMMKGLELSLAGKKLPEAESARKIQALLQQTVNHAGDLARDLALADLEEDNLPSALKGLASNVKNLFDISCQFKSAGRIPPLDKNVIMQFYKITQEAVTNAVKHGKARQVGINLINASNRLTLTVRNNGLPFPSLIDQSKGMGLRIMNYRASVIGASLEIKPVRPKGTLVTCSLPNKPAPARVGNGRARQPR